jgi:hypothetical protein
VTNDGPTPTPKRTCTGLARTPDCRAARPMPLGRVAARTVKRPESGSIGGVFQPSDDGVLHSAESAIALCAAWRFNDRSIVMEDLGLRALYRRVAGIDVHRMLHVVTVLIAQPDGAKKNAPCRIKQLKAIGRWPSFKPAAASH